MTAAHPFRKFGSGKGSKKKPSCLDVLELKTFSFVNIWVVQKRQGAAVDESEKACVACTTLPGRAGYAARATCDWWLAKRCWSVAMMTNYRNFQTWRLISKTSIHNRIDSDGCCEKHVKKHFLMLMSKILMRCSSLRVCKLLP